MTVPTFDIHGPAIPDSPVVLSVPHAGRDYPETSGLLRHPVERLRALEDRHADCLAERAIASGTTAIVARLPRLWIDLNRATSDLDPGMVVGGYGSAQVATSRMRGGLGLIPRRLGTIGEIWRAGLAREDVARRIAGHYDPYHAMISAMLARAHARFGVAMLVDLHSMPPLVADGGSVIVLGDRFGATCAPQLTALAEAVFAGAGYRVCTNAPYAGGHIITRHANRLNNVHAIQVEVDRSLYLDAALDSPGQGVADMQAVIGRLVETLAAQLLAPTAIAAE